MTSIIQGRDLSVYTTVGLTLGVSKKENRDGKKSRFVVISMKDSYSRLSKTRRTIIFEDEWPGLIDTLGKYVDKSIVDTHEGGEVVSLAMFQKSEDAKLFPIMEWPGMMPQVMPLRKGMCYANDVNGNVVTDKTGARVTKDKITVMVQVKNIVEGQDHPNYVDGWDPDTQLNNMESRFYRVPVVQMGTNDADDTQFMTPAPQQQPAQQPAQQASQQQQAPQQATQQQPAQMPPQQPMAGMQAPF